MVRGKRGVQVYGRLTNTDYERLALDSRINLSDGHAKHTLTASQRRVWDGASALFDEAVARNQLDMEQEFLDVFARAASQDALPGLERSLLSYSCSSAIALAATLCRLRGLRVLLIEPCFDNIRLLLLSQGVEVAAIQEADLLDAATLEAQLTRDVALWLVLPNNPTGFVLDEGEFRNVVNAVANAGATLLVDFSFRFFARSLYTWSQYKTLEESGVDYICFEDTGKTWALADMKVGVSVCSRSLIFEEQRLHNELLLSVSPFHLLMLREFMRLSISEGVADSVRGEVDLNRRHVRRLLESGCVESASPHCENTSLEFLRLSHSDDSVALWASLRERGVDILPAANYFWSAEQLGRDSFRIPLARPPADIVSAIPVIDAVLRQARGKAA